jgi:hypothetical protein
MKPYLECMCPGRDTCEYYSGDGLCRHPELEDEEGNEK